MEAFLLVVHLILIVALVASVLIQRNEGGLGGLGGGSGGGAGGMGGFLSGRSQANLLTRTTAILATGFFATSLALAYIGAHRGNSGIIVPESPVGTSTPAPVAPQEPASPAAPTGQ